MSEFVDVEGVPLSGTQWSLVVDKVRKGYWRLLQYTKAEYMNVKLTKKRKLLEIAQVAHKGSSADEEDVGDERGKVKDFEQAAMPKNWNPIEYTIIFLTLGS